MSQLPDWKNESAERFSKHAQTIIAPIYRYLLQDLQAMAERDLQGLTLMEIGCGPAFMNQHFIKAGLKKIYEVDISHSMLVNAKTRINNDKTFLLTADAATLPLKEQSVDLVFSRGSIFFWKNLERCLQEINRIMRPQGFALIGGGYGLSTPEEVLHSILEHRRQKKDESSIPRLDLNELLKLARCVFSQAEIRQQKKRGFWLSCHKK